MERNKINCKEHGKHQKEKENTRDAFNINEEAKGNTKEYNNQ